MNSYKLNGSFIHDDFSCIFLASTCDKVMLDILVWVNSLGCFIRIEDIFQLAHISTTLCKWRADRRGGHCEGTNRVRGTGGPATKTNQSGRQVHS